MKLSGEAAEAWTSLMSRLRSRCKGSWRGNEVSISYSKLSSTFACDDDGGVVVMITVKFCEGSSSTKKAMKASGKVGCQWQTAQYVW